MAKIIMAPREENKIARVEINDYRFIPVIFIPGIMGSNLKTNDKKNIVVWRYDSNASLLGWATPFSGAVERKNVLDPKKVEVDDRGDIVSTYLYAKEVDRLKKELSTNYNYMEYEGKYQKIKQLEENDPETKLFGTRRSRGWGEVAAASYGTFLDSLQNLLFHEKPDWDKPLGEKFKSLLNQPLGTEYCCEGNEDSLNEKDLDVIKKYYYPVHAMGYNWLGSNKDSAKRLDQKITEIVAGYKARSIKCHKVILITHSMGGLVARYYSECLVDEKSNALNRGKKNVYGIIHGVMPSTGAAAAYTRIKRGTENPESSLVGYVTSHILSRDAAEMTAICSQSPGPLELLPPAEYGSDWLKITDRHGKTFLPVEDDPYANVYLKRDVWWKLMDENLLNPLNKKMDKKQIEDDWVIYQNLIKDTIKFHRDILNKYHINTYSFYGKVNGDIIPEAYRTQEVARWKGNLATGDVKLLKKKALDDGRLLPEEIMEKRTVVDNLSESEKAWRASDQARGRLKNHYKNIAYIGQCFTLQDASENGDGTVPVRSGQIPDKFIKERLSLNIAHEPAYRHEISQAFTLRSIIKIAQEVNHDAEMAWKD
ncbi:hypothetical protein [Kalamiella sp. sgz302252]|uniref:lipase family alpha/beta hydrolase n=1 Tax=Pantoea sp. sgz302252 TaxID=3341827 RepID=UPI0036D426CC